MAAPVGLEDVRRRAAALAPDGSRLHDRVRDQRGADHPPTLSEGCARDHARLFRALARGEVLSAGVSEQVLAWLSTGTDLSMVAGAFDLDPLAHPPTASTRLAHKTGSDPGVRADAGTARWRGREASYAVICAWEPVAGAPQDERSPAVLTAMRSVGAAIRRDLEA